MGLKVRFGGIALLIFLALFFDPMDVEFKWDVVSGVCEEVYNYSGNENDESFTPIDDVQGVFSCGEGSISIPVPKIALLIDIPTFLFVWGITFFVVYTRKGDRIRVYEEASHIAKDVGELAAAIGAFLVFWGQFNERSMSIGFGVAFLSYCVGLATSLFLRAYAEHLKRQRLQNEVEELPISVP